MLRTSSIATCEKNMNWIARHVRRYLRRKPWDFCWRIGVESTVAGLVVGVFLSTVFGAQKREFLNFPIWDVFFLMLVVAPLVETLLFQAFPIFIVRMLKGSIRVQIAVSTLLFAAAHFPEGVATGVSAGLIGGMYFAFAYARWRKRSRWQAFWITAAGHSIHNGILFILLVVFGNWS